MSYVLLFKLGAWSAAAFYAAIGLFTMWATRWRRTPERPAVIGVTQILLASVASFVCFALTAIALGAVGIGIFGVVQWAFSAGAVVPPILGLALLIVAARQRSLRVPWPARMLAVLLLLPIPVCAHASLIAPYQLVLERVSVPIVGLSSNNAPISIAVLADIQTDRITAYEHAAVDRALAEQPDIILLPGDFFQGTTEQYREQLPHFRKLFARLDAPGGVYACRGNIDSRDRAEELFSGTNVQLLENTITNINVRGQKIAIGGLGWDCADANVRQTFASLRDAPADVRILLCHTPDWASVTAPTDRIDLVVAGHTHGGQLIIPGFGAIARASAMPPTVAAGGLHRVHEQMLYISRGVGYERGLAPPLRLNCPPEVSILSLSVEQ